MDTTRAADLLEEIADLLEMRGENPFRIRAYTNAARTLRLHDQRDLAGLASSGELSRLPGIGKAISEKLVLLVETGRIPQLDELRASVPAGVRELLRIPGLGPRKAAMLVEGLRVGTVGELEYACHENRVAHLPGFGSKSQEKILEGIRRLRRYASRFLLGEALTMAEAAAQSLKRQRSIRRVAIAGDLRRGLETVAGIDLVACGPSPADALEAAASCGLLENAAPEGADGLAGSLAGGPPVRLHVVPEEGFAAALLHDTGSAEHVEALSARARGLGLEWSARGPARGGALLPSPDEEAIYRHLDLPFIPPELRSGDGEIDAAAAGALPRLIGPEDVRGVLHVHSTWSDGRMSIPAILERCAGLGYEYVGITDHSQSARYARGLTPDSLRRQQEEIDAASARHPGLRVFKGSEVDILPDGRLDYPEEVLARLDFIVASVHSSFGLSRADQTRRIVGALRNRRTTILGHPTGRLLLAREPYDVDLDEVARVAAAEGVYLELNANPRRLDLDAVACRRARSMEARFAIDPDAHDAGGLTDVRYGVLVARRAGLEAGDVLNTLDAARLADALRRRL